MNPEDRLYGILPLSHIVGLSIVFLGTLLSGATIYLEPRFDPVAARVALERERITIMLGAVSYTHLDVYKRQVCGGPEDAHTTPTQWS